MQRTNHDNECIILNSDYYQILQDQNGIWVIFLTSGCHDYEGGDSGLEKKPHSILLLNYFDLKCIVARHQLAVLTLYTNLCC